MRFWIVLSLLALPATAFSQEAVRKLDKPALSPQYGDWTVKWSVSSDQSFAIDRDQFLKIDRDDIQDEGEYTAGARITGSFPRIAEISFSPLITVNPHFFDSQDESSAWSLKVNLQRKIETTNAMLRNERRREQDNIIPFVSYRYGQSFDGVFEHRSANDHEVVAGTSYTNVLGYLCAADETPRERCTGEAGTQYKITASYSQIDSSNDDRDRSGPKLALEWQRPFLATSGLFVNASAERRFYEELRSTDGTEDAEADQYSVAIGVDLSRWARRTFSLPDQVDFKISARWIGADSNNTTLERDELAIVPSLSWSR
jgi:hypothetical protein